MIDVQQSLSAWISQVQGKYINADGAYGAQCWDLAANWSSFLGLPVINTGYDGRWIGWAGNMVDAYPQTPEIAAAYELVGPNQSGLPGDIVVWDDSYWYYPATHVAVLVADKGPQLMCMSQNSTPSRPDNPYPGLSSGPTTIQSLPRQGLIGFLRPRIGLAPMGTSTPTEEIDVAAEANLKARLDEIVAWQDTQFQEIRDTQERNRNALAGFVRDVVAAGGELTAAEIDAKFAALAASPSGPGVLLYKGKDSPAVYVYDEGKGFRHIGIEEYIALTTSGANLRELDQAIIDALPRA